MVAEEWLMALIISLLCMACIVGVVLVSLLLDSLDTKPRHYFVNVNEGVGMNAGG
jgi:hypothetical protein